MAQSERPISVLERRHGLARCRGMNRWLPLIADNLVNTLSHTLKAGDQF
jgi:hypothetical protein